MALTRKKITVRGKNGKTFQRSVMVRAGEAVKRTAGKVGRFVNKHKGKIAAVAGAAALAGGLAYAHNKGHINLGGMASNARHAAGSAASAVHGAAKEGARRTVNAAKRPVEKYRSAYAAATHPDRVAQGHDNSHAAGVKAGVRAAAKAATAPIRAAASSVANSVSSVSNVVSRAAVQRSVRRKRSREAGSAAARTRSNTTLQLGSGA